MGNLINSIGKLRNFSSKGMRRNYKDVKIKGKGNQCEENPSSWIPQSTIISASFPFLCSRAKILIHIWRMMKKKEKKRVRERKLKK